MRNRKLALGAILLVTRAGRGGARARDIRSAPPRRAAPSRLRGSTSARTTTAGGRRPTRTADCTSRRCSARRCRRRIKENIAVGAQFNQTVASLVAQGYKLIFATSYGYITPQLAAKYPDVDFEQATGTYVSKNVAEYFGAAEDTVYLSGMAAGAAAKCNTIGYVVAFPIPEVIRHANAFALGAQATHPGVKVKLIWTNSWYDPAKEKKAAQSLVWRRSLRARPERRLAGDRAVRAVQEARPWVGYDSDAQSFAKTSWLTASVYNWGPYYLKRVKAAMNGTWKSGFYYGEHHDGFTKLAPYGPDVVGCDEADRSPPREGDRGGTFNEFTGPLYDQSGKLRVAKGVKMQVLKGGTNSLYGMNWLVKGVIGSPKG